jgi:DNA-binding CsgD family transcriptional regulator
MTHTHPADSALASRRPKTRSTDLLDLLARGEPPAFANDASHRIIFWNKGAEQVMGRTAAQTLGRLCHEVFCGRDAFGNRYCAEVCAVENSFARNEAVRRFEITTGDSRTPQLLGFTVIQYPDASGDTISVHLMDQVRHRPEIAQEIDRLQSVEPVRDKAARRAGRVDPAGSQVKDLSEREREVLGSIASGLSNKEIATALGISVATARNHVQNILRKLAVHSKLEAVALAFNKGWVSVHDTAAAARSAIEA